MNFFKNELRRLAVWSSCVIAAACSTEEWNVQDSGLALKEGEIALQWLPANMGIHQVATRAEGDGDPKTALERKINNVHIFIFKEDGSYLEADGDDAFQGYRYLEGSQNLVLNSNMFEKDPEAAEHACVYVLANMPKNYFGEIGVNGKPQSIADRNALEEKSFNLPEFTAALPATGLPMVIRQDGVDLSTDAPNKVVLLQLHSLMARIDLNFKMEPDQYDEGVQYPALRINSVKVGNFPTGGKILSQLDDGKTEETQGDLILEEKSVEWDGLGQAIRRNGGDLTLTLYMFEHSREAKSLSDIFGRDNYPENITPVEKQRYKNALATEGAAYIELKGTYTNHNNYTYDNVTYRLYPGANPDDDFTIKRNCQYKNNITIMGITVNNEGNEALLDTRVNIDRTANPYFIEMLRERKHDAHFNVTPMDVFLYEPGSSVKVEIVEPESHRWIRMEPYKTAVKNKNESNDKYLWVNEGAVTCKYAAKGAGDGKRKYFTTDLFAGLNAEGELGNQENSTSYTVTWDANDTEQDGDGHTIHEERIYFYIDENVPQDAGNGYSNLDAAGNVMDRSVTVRITYTSLNGNEEIREAEIKQYGMLRVPFDKFQQGQYSSQRDGYIFYIEYYEEYLEHYDGKNTYNETYDGLEWGFMGIETNLDGREWHTYLDYGWRNTKYIMQQFRNQLRGDEVEDIDLNTRPRGAAEYCYNKNKRNERGQVEEIHWYLPTISELEYALDRYYGTFEVFQEQWYWSSNPGCSYNDTGENPDYARATQVRYDPTDPEAINDFVHAQSSANHSYYEGKGGHARRNEVFRIRAAYVHDIEKDRNSYWKNNIPTNSN